VQPQARSSHRASKSRVLDDFAAERIGHRMKARAIAIPLACLTVVAVAAQPSVAQPYPSRPIRLVVGFAPGGNTDFVARLVANELKPRLGQNVVIENKPGANGAIGAEYVAKAEPDGYTLLFSTAGAIAINPSMRTDLPYDPQRDFAAVAPIARNTVLFAASRRLEAATAPDMIALARARPGTVTVAITGFGAISHLTLELLQARAGLKLQFVPYRGAGQAIADFVAGQIDAMSADVPVLLPQIRAGKGRVLAVASAERSDALPDVPTFAELGYPGVIADNWSGVLAPAGIAPPVVARLNGAFNAVVGDTEVRRKLAESGVSALGGSAADLTALMRRETERWRKVVAELGLQATSP
jgi:tripartite-type tricarboxylate transporter receptor subunit TctC